MTMTLTNDSLILLGLVVVGLSLCLYGYCKEGGDAIGLQQQQQQHEAELARGPARAQARAGRHSAQLRARSPGARRSAARPGRRLRERHAGPRSEQPVGAIRRGASISQQTASSARARSGRRVPPPLANH